jgi:hypothetical protein
MTKGLGEQHFSSQGAQKIKFMCGVGRVKVLPFDEEKEIERGTKGRHGGSHL